MRGYVMCICCGRSDSESLNLTRVGGGEGHMHFSCWEEHHSDPMEVWPPGHKCADGTER